jgi:hypothetical protein
MLEVLALVMAGVSLGVSLLLALKVASLSSRPLLAPVAPRLEPVAPALEDLTPSILQGSRVALSITQDHPHPVFVDCLKEVLFQRDAADVVLVEAGKASDCDLLIEGSVVCNGYANVYYEADLSCSEREQPICRLIEKPPHGDRPSNLALELVSRIEKELHSLSTRGERGRAVRELKEL